MDVDRLDLLSRAVTLLIDHERRRARRAVHQAQIEGNSAKRTKAEAEVTQLDAWERRLVGEATPAASALDTLERAVCRLLFMEHRRLRRQHETASRNGQTRVAEQVQLEIEAVGEVLTPLQERLGIERKRP